MRANQKAHVNEQSLIGCLLHALYETSTSSTPQRFFPLAPCALQEAGLGGHPGHSPAAGCLDRRVGPLRDRRRRVHRTLEVYSGTDFLGGGAAGGVNSLLFFVGPLQRGLQAAGIELRWAGSISARWTDAPGSRLDRGSAAE